MPARILRVRRKDRFEFGSGRVCRGDLVASISLFSKYLRVALNGLIQYYNKSFEKKGNE